MNISCRRTMALALFLSALLFSRVLPIVLASDQENAAADAVASAFVKARQEAHLPNLEEMGRNAFRRQVCQRDMHFRPGLIGNVTYQTSDPAHLSEPAQQLATSPDLTKRRAARFGVGVCLISDGGSFEKPKYSVLVAIYLSRWESFWQD
jgi:hypothetical protein